MDKTPFSRQEMCNWIAREFQDGWIVNLGAGIPTLCSNYDLGATTIIFHSENGIIGYGPLAPKGEEQVHLVDAFNQYITLVPGAATVHHADSFMLIRGGRLDATVMGAYEVAENGDFANWKMAGRKGRGIGGAMDLAAGARNVYIVMEHTTKDAKPRLRRRCTLPLTAAGAVKLLATNLGVFETSPRGFKVRQLAPGYTLDAIQAVTEARLIAA